LSAVAGAGPSGLARAPKVACAARGPRPATLAGNPAQSLPQAACKVKLKQKNQASHCTLFSVFDRKYHALLFAGQSPV